MVGGIPKLILSHRSWNPAFTATSRQYSLRLDCANTSKLNLPLMESLAFSPVSSFRGRGSQHHYGEGNIYFSISQRHKQIALGFSWDHWPPLLLTSQFPNLIYLGGVCGGSFKQQTLCYNCYMWRQQFVPSGYRKGMGTEKTREGKRETGTTTKTFILLPQQYNSRMAAEQLGTKEWEATPLQ